MADSKVCPRRQTDLDAWRWMELYGHYTAGHLYVSGGISDQPALYLSVMRLIDGAVKEARSEAYGKVQN